MVNMTWSWYFYYFTTLLVNWSSANISSSTITSGHQYIYLLYYSSSSAKQCFVSLFLAAICYIYICVMCDSPKIKPLVLSQGISYRILFRLNVIYLYFALFFVFCTVSTTRLWCKISHFDVLGFCRVKRGVG